MWSRDNVLDSLEFLASSLATLLSLLWQKDGLDVGQDAALGDRNAGQKLAQLLVVTDGQLQVTRDDPGLLVVTRSIACKLKDLSRQILHDSCHVDGSPGTDTLSIVAFP